MNKFVFAFIFIFALIFITATPVLADNIPSSKAIKAIIGEAENQGPRGMLAVACAIKNRGTLKGVYGLHANRVVNHKYSEMTWLNAQSAWEIANNEGGPDTWGIDTCEFIHDAKNWENTNAFGVPYWAKGMNVVFVYKDHKFFR